MVNESGNSKVVKELITIGIFNAIAIAVFFAVGLSLSFITTLIPVVAVIMPAILALPGGIIYLLMITKAPTKGVFIISGILLGVFMVAVGNMVFFLISMTVAGFAAEAVFTVIGRKKFWAAATGFAVLMIGFVAGGYFPMIFMRKAYLDFQLARGLDSAYLEAMIAILNPGVFAGIIIITATAAYLGSLWGRKVLHKHFAKAGIL